MSEEVRRPWWRAAVDLPETIGWRDHVIGALIGCAYVAWLLSTARSLGFARDEGFYFHAATTYARWFELLASSPHDALKRASVDAIIVVAAVLAFIAYAAAIRSFESRHVKAFIALLIALTVFSVVLYDTSLRIGRVEGPRLEALEASSSP